MNIVVGYTPTPEGIAATDYARDYAKEHGAKLTVINTGKDGNYADKVFASQPDLDALSAELTNAGVDFEILQPTEGKAAGEVILETVAAIPADLLVIGMRRRSPVGKLLFGSTAQQLLLDADCPVISVKAKH